MCRAADAPAAGKQPPAAQPANAKIDQAAKLVQQALKAEAAGKPAERDALLKQALAIAPDYAPAHWQRGEVKSSTGWVSVDEAAKRDAHSAKLDEYRQLRDQAGVTVDEQLNLARWCEKAGLKEQQRAHLLFALDLDPGNKEATTKLGLVRYRGQLVPTAQLDDIKAQVKQSFAESNQWKQQAAQWLQQWREKPQTRDDILKQIRAIRDPAAIPSLEKMLSNSGLEVGKAIVECLAAMPQQAATESLLRFAVFSPYDEVAKTAIYALKSRSPYGYVPILLLALKMPIQYQYDILNFSSYNFVHQLKLYQEEPDRNDLLVTYENKTSLVGQATSGLSRERAVGNTINKIEHINQHAEEFNSVLADVLEQTTGQQLGSDPTAWWSWWLESNEFYEPPQKPDNISSVTVRRAVSCFPAGTPVWTMSGPMQIENIKVGELVLAQDSRTSELAYKPVIGTTIRPPSALIETKLGETVIRSTRGHPFWVSGIGWQMAKELKAGQWLHTARGMMQIDSAEPSDEAVCFNLVVADFHDYFVSGAKLLVHDNLLRGPTMATVPGLADAK
ncbi:MAG TPA: polymorphic toxin-type HINT domain-containing protein [Pirellulales bacterium]|jgi:hypothetical protein|nr:polymorphic toxin-type HINT domain-containing protein [Pirellulales bacterium]